MVPRKKVKIIAALKKSHVYDSDYVAKIYSQVEKYAPGIPFYCISNVEVPCRRIPMTKMWPGWWCKMELFRPDIEDDIFFLDLDTIITDDITDLINVGELTMLTDFYHPTRYGSGLMYLPKSARNDVWRLFVKNPPGHIRMHRAGGDQAFLASCFNERPLRWQEVFPGKVISYKAHRVHERGVPEGTSVVCFHGVPKCRDIGWDLGKRPDLKIHYPRNMRKVMENG